MFKEPARIKLLPRVRICREVFKLSVHETSGNRVLATGTSTLTGI